MEERKRLAFFILFRVVVVSIFLVSTIILNAGEPGSFSDEVLTGLFKLVIATYLFSIFSLAVLRYTDRFQQPLTYFQIIWDLQLVTLLILLTGGINSPYSFLYILSIINASVLLARREAIYTASLCAILYGAILDLQFYGRLDFFGLSQSAAQQYGASYLFYTVFINILAYFLTAILTGHLAERARRSETALHEKEIDYEELERLNSSIVFNLDSCLLTLNSDCRIRVFNHFAEKLTGITQEGAYDSYLTDIFPGLHLAECGQAKTQFGELDYLNSAGSKAILEFKAVPLTDRDGRRSGVMVALKDVTRLKAMEAELKKADRLAAIGELAARIAHEIRNPLASISGSVQLIAQGNKVDATDRRLLGIVLRETDRLNELIKDFLAYARPTTPQKMTIQLKPFFSDLTSLLSTDSRFERIEITCGFPDNISVSADRDQFQQVFLNLLVNAADAMPSGGTIWVTAGLLAGNDSERDRGRLLSIVIADTGKGITDDDMKRVFEPFFTTKSGGTGLGLATVYRIIESHAGTISVASSAGCGTSFTICLPCD